ncbi:hypothetical protein DXG01_010635 [Tephrocybe rancida]|nr:hypothetical protein DXG01_010635 [Tephrocybe rancida]
MSQRITRLQGAADDKANDEDDEREEKETRNRRGTTRVGLLVRFPSIAACDHDSTANDPLVLSMTRSEKPNQEPLIVRVGRVRIKGQGSLSGWAWRVKSLVLTNEALVIPGNKIPLDHITKIERVDLKPYCLLLQVKNRTYHLSFENDGELYDWQDDVYSRCPAIGVGNPSDFVHNVHVGFDQLNNSLPTQWNDLVNPASPTLPTDDREKADIDTKHISTTTNQLPSLSYTPQRTQRAVRPKSSILDGQLSIKVDGFFTGWRWVARWIVLRNKTLTIYRSQGAPGGLVINLDDISKVVIVKARRLRIVTKSGKRYSLSFRTAAEAVTWRDAISPKITVHNGEISHPWGFTHKQHIGFDPVTGEFTGTIPESWQRLLTQPSQGFKQPPVHVHTQAAS